MSARIDRPSLWVRLALPAASLAAIAGLGMQALGHVEVAGAMGAAAPWVLLLGVVSAGALGLAAWRHPERRIRLGRDALLVPCVLAPLAALSPWTVAPSPLGPGLGGLPFFLSWLTRYPTVGPVNHEVLLGTLAVLGACALPAALAHHVATSRHPRVRTIALLAALQLAAYLPVLVRLDAALLAHGWTAVQHGSLGPVVAPGRATAGWQSALLASRIAVGPLLRLAATASMLAFVPIGLRARAAPAEVWETA